MQAEHLLGSHAEGTSLWFVGLPDFHEDPYYTMQPLWNAFPSLVEKPHALLDYSQVSQHLVCRSEVTQAINTVGSWTAA